jgi:chorismate synthase
MSDSIGKLFVVTSFGESHGRCVGAIVEGCPAGLSLSDADIQTDLDRRRPTGAGSTPRAEEDRIEILSGVFNGHTTGAPIAMLVANKDVHSGDYEKTRFLPRPGHADYTAYVKYGGFNDFRGGGRFSGRITASFVMAGAVARKLLDRLGIEVMAHTIQIGNVLAGEATIEDIRNNARTDPVHCADSPSSALMVKAINKARRARDSVGGVVRGLALNVPAGLGEPVFDTIEGELAKAFFAIPAVKSVAFGAGVWMAMTRGSKVNDAFAMDQDRVVTTSNNSGGILGGISNGMPIAAEIAFKPTPSIPRPQQTVDLRTMTPATVEVRGRHDTCIVPRAVVVVESMMAITLCDFALRAGLLPRVIK